MAFDIAIRSSCLVIIDMQRCMREVAAEKRNNLDAERNIALLLAAYREVQAPIVHVRHLSRDPSSGFWPGQPGVEFQPEFAPIAGERVVEKNVPDAFIRTDFEQWLRSCGIKNLIIVGVSTNYSVESTARTAGNLDFTTYVVSDAVFAFSKADFRGVLRAAEDVHAMSLANLDGEFATIISTNEVLSTPM